MAYTVMVLEVRSYWIAATRGRAKADEVSSTMLALLGRAWDLVKQSGIKTDGQNVAIYKGDMIEAGARIFEKFEGEACVATPAGLAATTVHMGPYHLLGKAHLAIREWCAANGDSIESTNWEIYGHHEEDPARRRTDVFYLLRS